MGKEKEKDSNVEDSEPVSLKLWKNSRIFLLKLKNIIDC